MCMLQIILIINLLIVTATYEMLHSGPITAVLPTDDIINTLPVQLVTSLATVERPAVNGAPPTHLIVLIKQHDELLLKNNSQSSYQ